jgi:hypothetical protein
MVTAIQISTVPLPPPAHTPTIVQGGGASPEARLLALMVYSQMVQGESAATSVELNQNQIEELRKQVREALEEAREANESSGFWGDIGDVLGGDVAALAGMVAMGAAAIASGGTAAIALAAVAIGCGLAAKYGEELGLPPKLALGLGIVAALTSVAAGNVSSLAQSAGAGAAQAGASAAQAGAGAAQAGSATQAGAAAAQAASSATQAGTGAAQASRLVHVAREVGYYAKLTQSGAAASGVVANGASAFYARDAQLEKADAAAGKSQVELRSMSIDDALSLLADALDSQSNAVQSTSTLLVANQNADQLILSSFLGVA